MFCYTVPLVVTILSIDSQPKYPMPLPPVYAILYTLYFMLNESSCFMKFCLGSTPSVSTIVYYAML